MSAPAHAAATAFRLPPPSLKPYADAIPEYRDALRRVQAAETWLNRQPPVPPPNIPNAETGAQIDEWLAAVDNYDAEVARHDRHRQRVLAIKQHASADAAAVFTANVNPIFRALHAELEKLLDNAADAVSQLDGARTAEQAIAGDCGPAWRTLLDLAGEYSALRSSQEWLLLNVAFRMYWATCRPTLPGEDHQNLAYIKNLPDLWPNWRSPDRFTRQVNIDGSKPRLEPWPADHGPELLIWLVESDAQPWIPTTTQLDELLAELRDRDNADPQPASAERQPLNRAPRPAAGYFDRVAMPLNTVSQRPPELAELD